jgi:hypothetical protein
VRPTTRVRRRRRARRPSSRRRWRRADLEQLGEQIAATIEKAKADDPRELSKRIAELERQIKNHESRPAAPAKEKRVEVQIIARIEKVAERFEGLTTTLADARTQVVDALRSARAAVQQSATARGGFVHGSPVAARHHGARDAATAGSGIAAAADRGDAGRRRSESAGSASSSNGHLPSGEKATLIAAAQYPSGLTREQASILTGYKRSTRDAYLVRLATKGYIEVNGGMIFATESGVAALGNDYEPLPTGEDLRAYWLHKLPAGEGAVLEQAIAGYPDAVSRDDITETTGYKRSTRDAYIQRLQARQLLAKGGGPVRASDTLF